MARILVVGASGAVGRFLLPRLRGAGHDVIALSRTPRVSADPRLRWLVGDLDANLPELPPVDVMISVGPLDAFSRWFARARVARTPRVIALGSMSVLTKCDSPDPDERALAARLRAAERQLADAAAACDSALTVFRPTLIYGAGIDRSVTPIARFARRWRVFPRIAAASGLRQPVHADDLAAACVAVIGNERTVGRTYALGGGERLTFAAMLARVRASLPVATLPLPIPLVAARGMAALARASGWRGISAMAARRLRVDLVADHAPAVVDFGWSPRAFQPIWETWASTRDGGDASASQRGESLAMATRWPIAIQGAGGRTRQDAHRR